MALIRVSPQSGGMDRDMTQNKSLAVNEASSPVKGGRMVGVMSVRNSRGSMVLALGCVVVSMTACAQFFVPVPESGASDIRMRNQLRNMATDAAKRI